MFLTCVMTGSAAGAGARGGAADAAGARGGHGVPQEHAAAAVLHGWVLALTATVFHDNWIRNHGNDRMCITATECVSLPPKTAMAWARDSDSHLASAGEMRALLPVFSTMLRFSPADVQRCQGSAAKWEAAAGASSPPCSMSSCSAMHQTWIPESSTECQGMLRTQQHANPIAPVCQCASQRLHSTLAGVGLESAEGLLGGWGTWFSGGAVEELVPMPRAWEQ